MVGAAVYNRDGKGTSSNRYGFYSITLPAGEVSLMYSYVGYVTQTYEFVLNRDTVINAGMIGALQLKEVEVTAAQTNRIQETTQMSALSVPVSQIKSIPALLGEVDVLKVLQLMPGIQSGGEGSSGLYVRGGGPDQNLILLDDVPVYNASHLFGFFSVFNADAINNVELLKGGFPARYGGRVSSVIDVGLKEGNTQHFHGEGSIGVVAAKLTLEGPIVKDKTSFIISGRRTYIDLLARPFIKAANESADISDVMVGYYFYDLTAKINHKISSKDRIYLSAYMGNDKFYAEMEETTAAYSSKVHSGLLWGNITGAFRWNRIFTNRLFGNTTFTYSRYRMNIYMKEWETETMNDIRNERYYGMDYRSGIEDWSVRMAFDYLPSPNHYIRFGGNATSHTFNPGSIGATSEQIPISFGGRKIHAYEYSLYAEDDIRLTSRLKANAGLHWSAFSVRGKLHNVWQPRFSARYLLTDALSAKVSYSRMAQYIHLLTNSNLGLPTDLWVPSTNILNPQLSHQTVAGVAWNVKGAYELSVEGYYKTMDNVMEYREGASAFDVHHQWEDKILQGEGRSYGVELFVQKKTGTFTGWVGYTLSWSDRRFDDLNGGRRFSYRYDRRHDISAVAVKRFGERVELSGTWIFGSGNCITVPTGIFDASDPFNPDTQLDVLEYGERNGYRMAPYHRLDISISLIRKKRWGESRWIFGVYNAYNRRNPYYIDIDERTYHEGNPTSSRQDDYQSYTQYRYKQVSLFPIIPSISYRFKF
jgi:outer membrane cobalamin receptor